MAVPKRRQSKSRSRKRRSHNSITPPQRVYCPQCNNILPNSHAVCGNCGCYQGRAVVVTEEVE